MQPVDAELALRVVTADGAGDIRRKDPVGADDPIGPAFAHDQVFAVGVEVVDVVVRHHGGYAGAEFLDEHLVAQPLRFADFLFAARQGDRVACVLAGGVGFFDQLLLHGVLLFCFWGSPAFSEALVTS